MTYACGALDGLGGCATWVEIATWAHLSPSGAVEILTAVMGLFALAWGFRLLLRFVLNH